MPVRKEQETTFNKALRMVMAEYDIQGTDLAKISGVSENAISRARKKAIDCSFSGNSCFIFSF